MAALTPPPQAERESLASAIEVACGDDRMHDDVRTERGEVVAEGEGGATVTCELDEGNVDRKRGCAHDCRVDRRDVLEEVALLADDVLDRVREIDVLRHHQDAKRRGRHARLPSAAEATLPEKT